MNRILQKFWPSLATVLAFGTGDFCRLLDDSRGEAMEGVRVTLSGDEEVPPVKTAASGTGTFVISADKSVTGSITTQGD